MHAAGSTRSSPVGLTERPACNIRPLQYVACAIAVMSSDQDNANRAEEVDAHTKSFLAFGSRFRLVRPLSAIPDSTGICLGGSHRGSNKL